MIKIYDNFLPDYFANSIEGLHMSALLDWRLRSSTVSDEYDNKGNQTVFYNSKEWIDTPQFTHTFYGNETGHTFYITEIENALKYINTNYKDLFIHRIKSNLNVPWITTYKKENYQPPHTDSLHTQCKSLLYYVNDTDGDTYFFDKDLTIVDKVSPKKNRAILFPSSMIHAGSNPIKNKLRIVINFVFSEEKVQGIKNYYKLGDADKAMFQDMGNVFDNFKLGEKV